MESSSSSSSCENNDKKRLRDDPGEPELDSPEVKRLRDDLLGPLEDADAEPAARDLDSVIKSLENEIRASEGTGVTQPELGYLFEASDDELGLPPTTTASTEVVKEDGGCWSELFRVSSGMDELWGGMDEQFAGYDALELGMYGNYGAEYGALGGAFEYPDARFDSTDFPALRQETLP